MKFFFFLCFLHTSLFANFSKLQTIDDVVSFFPKTIEQIDEKQNELFEFFKENMETVLQMSEKEKSFEMVVLFDQALGAIENYVELLFTLVMTHTNKDIRDFSNLCANQLASKAEEYILSNPKLYKILKNYAENTKETLSELEKYYLDEILSSLELLGLSLSDEKRSRLIDLNRSLNILCSTFSKNIMEDQRSIQVDEGDLLGLEQDYISRLEKDGNKYVLYTDYPTVFPLLSRCGVSQTRKQMYQLFYNRGCPENIAILEQIIQLRDQMAKELGFKSFAHLQLEKQLIKNPEKALRFLNDLFCYSQKKENEEFTLLLKDLPQGVTLNEDGKLHPFDIAYVWDNYKKKNINLDHEYISEYFSLETCLDGFIDLFEKFFGMKMTKEEIALDWDSNLILLKITKNRKTLGFIVLDLFPRPMKYGHACMCPLIPAWKDYPALSMIIANFPEKTKSKPSLLNLDNARTLFHELGHAIHDILGRSDMILTCGTRVKRDFVELPSQLMEEWLWESEFLKLISRHYQTGETLSDEIIEKIIQSRNCDIGYWLQRQIFFSMLSLSYFLEGETKNSDELLKQIYERTRPNYVYHEDYHIQASFGHLTGYAAGYYGYLFTKVMALDFFEKIKKEGILNSEAGEKYFKSILYQGGKKDPNLMIQDYLGRDVCLDAFLYRLELNCN